MAVDPERKCILIKPAILSKINCHIATSSREGKKKKRKRDPDEDKTEIAKRKDEKRKKRRKDTVDETTPSTSVPNPIASTSASATPAATPSEVAEFLTKHSIAIHTPSNVPETTPVLSFAQLDIPADLRASFKAFTEPTPIQACTWPPALQGRDVVGIAETGRCGISIS